MSQFDQVMMFYNQLNNMADEVKKLIEKELYDYILDKTEHHERVHSQIRLIHRCIKFTEDEQAQIEELRSIVQQKEKENIEELRRQMNLVKLELNKTNLQNRIQKAYDQMNAGNKSTIIDVDDSYRGEA